MTCFAGSLYPRVILASPVSHHLRVRHSSTSAGPAARWMAPSTPPPPARLLLAAVTMASTVWRVMSPSTTSIRSRMSFDAPAVGLAGDPELGARALFGLLPVRLGLRSGGRRVGRFERSCRRGSVNLLRRDGPRREYGDYVTSDL